MGGRENRARDERACDSSFFDNIRDAERWGNEGNFQELAGADGNKQEQGRQSNEANAAYTVREAYATTREIAQFLRVHPKTVERLRKFHGLPFVRIGGSIRYSTERVASWASAQEG
jgi:excisionase family DNA binding protein